MGPKRFVVAAAAIALGVGVGQTLPSLVRLPHSDRAVGASSVIVVRSIPLVTTAYDLYFDVRRNAVWFPQIRLDDTDALARVSLADGTMDSWPIPDVVGNGYESRVKGDDDGDIWITEDYALIRFNPEAQRSTTYAFALESDVASDDAISEDNALPGTWISAIAPSPTGVWVARNNIPALTFIDTAAGTRTNFRIPERYSGARDIAVTRAGVSVLSGPQSEGALGLFSEAGKLLHEESVPSLLADARLVTVGPDAVVVSGGSTRSVIGGVVGATLPGPIERAAIDRRGNHLLYRPQENALEIVDQATASSRLIALPTWETIVGVPGSIGSQWRQLEMGPDITDLVVDSANHVWYSDASRDVLEEVRVE